VAAELLSSQQWFQDVLMCDTLKVLHDELEKLRQETGAESFTELTKDMHFYPDLHGMRASYYDLVSRAIALITAHTRTIRPWTPITVIQAIARRSLTHVCEVLSSVSP
jgi:hypothetical protein